ncbi:MAG TPA: PKD domain-containing protein [Flavisolibacter sp.]|nr:PKD domain-containing protein [Flavisolibacter sp.]
MTNKYSILLLLSFLYSFLALSQNIEFIENKGQWDGQVRYMGRVNAGAFFLHKNGFTVVQHNTKDWAQMTDMIHGHSSSNGPARRLSDRVTVRSHAYRVNFLNGNTKSQIVADKSLPTYNNYFIGSDTSNWAANCKIYQGITVKNIYPNINVRYYSGSGSVKYDLIVHPGGDPSAIALKYDGTEGLEVKGKELIIKTSVGELKELNPYTYQYNPAGRVTIGAKYTVKDNIVRFDIKNYDPKTTLVIDPDLIFCSFSGSSEDNWGFTATYGPDGSMYGGGVVFGQGFPVSTGSFQTVYGGGNNSGPGAIDIGIIKLTPDGKQRMYATYLGGSGNELPHSLIVNPQGELIVAGRSNSPNFPTRGVGLYGKGGQFDIIVTKLNAAGNNLVGSVRIGGTGDDGANINPYNGTSASSLLQNYGDDSRSEVNIDGAGNVYLASNTRSNDPAVENRFPTVNAVQPNPGGAQDGVVLKLDPSVNTLLFSTYLGGSANDAAYVLSLNPLNGNIYVAGGTESDNLPVPRTGTIGPNFFGGIDGFVSILTPDGSSIIRTSYIGTAGKDQVYGIQFDEKGFPYIMGQTTGSWQAINAAWSQANGKQFIAKLRPDLSAYVYSTMFGKGDPVPDISPVAFLVDRCENVYISGWGGKVGGVNFPNAGVIGLPVTPDALKTNADPGSSGLGEDFYFFVLKKDAASQLYGSFFGQNGGDIGDHVDGGTSRFDRNGVIYQAICASCGNNFAFPTFPTDVWARTKPTQECNLAMVKIAFNFAGTRGDVRPSINGVPRDSVGCVPLTVDFTDTIQVALLYEWNFGDGSPSIFTTKADTSHTYLNVGTYRVMMVAIDSTKCFPRDTSYTTIKVGDNQAIPRFNAVKLSPPCDIFRYRFDNTSIAPPGIPFRDQTFTWDFGDGSATITTGPAPVFHTYANAGTYVVKLLLSDTAYCNSPETLIDTLRVAANVRAIFKTPSAGCAPYNAVFKNESVGGAQFIWNFGDGSAPLQTTVSTVNYTYTIPGTYIVKLTAIDPNTCNGIDSTSFSITVAPIPTANFSASPQPPQVNAPIAFTNLSSPDAIRFKWVFGDGDSLLTTSRAAVLHEYNLTATYNTCLTAYNAAGCAAQLCTQVSTLVEPAVDVPNAFTPQSGDVNSRVFVRGFGIAKLKFAIYARWGEKVFETADKRIGWDGKYKGKLLPMDVYAYTMDVEFADGKKFQKTGDITLIR